MTLSNHTQSPYRRYLVAIGCFLMIMLGLGFCSSGKSLYLGAITKALDFKRSVFSLQDTLRYVTMVFTNLCFGFLIGKLGARKLACIGFCCFSLYLGISMFAEDLIWFYVAGVFLGLGMSFSSTTMVTYLVNLWFPEKRGTVSGAILCANGIGGAISAQLITPLIDAEPFGYRDAYRLAFLICIITGVLVTVLVTEPKGADRTVTKKKAKGRQWTGLTLQQALRKPYFYVAALCVALTGMSLQGIHGIAAAHMFDTGMDSDYVATVLSVGSLALVASKFLAGISYDKLGLRTTMAICEGCGVISFLCLALCSASPLGNGLAMTYSVLCSLALPLETVIVPLIAADLFGEQQFTKLLGIFVAVNYAGYAVGGFVYNLVYDLTGSYQLILLATAAIMLAILIAFQFIISAANRTRKQLETNQLP